MFIIKIVNAENKELIDSIWETDGFISTCIYPGKSKYIPGFKIKVEELGVYESVRVENLNE